jgi:hypothetical protein
MKQRIKDTAVDLTGILELIIILLRSNKNSLTIFMKVSEKTFIPLILNIFLLALVILDISSKVLPSHQAAGTGFAMLALISYR